jgi:hypothetical protein
MGGTTLLFLLTLKKNTALSNHLSYTGKQYHTHIISKTIMYAAFTHQSIIFAFSITTFIQAVSAEEQNRSCMMFWSPAHPKPLNTYFLLLLTKMPHSEVYFIVNISLNFNQIFIEYCYITRNRIQNQKIKQKFMHTVVHSIFLMPVQV